MTRDKFQALEPTRQDVVRVARSLVGRLPSGRPKIRFRHQGRSPRTGMDCAGLLVWVGHELGYRPDWDFRAYERYPDGKTLQRVLSDPLVRTGHTFNDASPGDIVLLRDVAVRWPMHLGIVGDHPSGELSLIHSWVVVRGVVESALPPEWTFKVEGIYSFPWLVGKDW